jgi:hypothetical protein
VRASCVCGQTDGLSDFAPSPGVSAGAYYRTGYMTVRANETIIATTIDIDVAIIIINIIIVSIIVSIVIIDIDTIIGKSLIIFTIKTVVHLIPSKRRF